LALFKEATSWQNNSILNTLLGRGKISVHIVEKKMTDFIFKWHKYQIVVLIFIKKRKI
jgi:hypothetical protein